MMQDQLYGGFWVDYYDTVFPAKENAVRAKQVITLIRKLKPDAKNMLELACGTGNYTIYWKDAFKVKATDLSKDMLVKAKKKCPSVTFKKISMTTFKEPPKYDVVTCMWESFRYNKTYGQVIKTLRNVNRALKNGGLFVVDFHHFPPKKDWFDLKLKSVIVKGKIVQEHQSLKTQGSYDVRKSLMIVNGKNVEVGRSPLLRISKTQMQNFFTKTGFKIAHFQRGFVGQKQSMLFIAKKVR